MIAEWLTLPKNGLEISDAIVSFDAATLRRKPIVKADLIAHFAAAENRAAVKIVEKIPDRDGFLCETAVDAMLVAAHCEMQRISEEFQHGRRMAQILRPIIATLRGGDGRRRHLRIVDIGCGTGFVLRWLAAEKVFENVEMIGADFNAALITEANALAQAENLGCRFVVGNAFTLNEPADIYLSTGILHHFRGAALGDLFAAQNETKAAAFVHFDFYNSFFAPFGSWLFHAVRMRAPLAKHDGVLSAIRSYKSRELLETAQNAAPDFATAVYGTKLWGLPVPRVFHTLVGIRRRYKDDFSKNLGGWRRFSLGVIE